MSVSMYLDSSGVSNKNSHLVMTGSYTTEREIKLRGNGF